MTTTIVQTLEETFPSFDAIVDRIGFKVAVTVQIVDIVPGKRVRLVVLRRMGCIPDGL